MAESQYTAPATYTITFPSLSEAEVNVSVNGVKLSTSDYSIANYSTSGSGTVTITSTVNTGDIVRVYRDTDVSTPEATFAAGASIAAADLNNNNLQLRYKLQEKAVSGDISTNAVTSDAIRDSAVTTDKIADGAVTTVKIADDAVTTDKLADNSVTNAQIADSSISGAKITDGTLDVAAVKAGDFVTLAEQNASPDAAGSDDEIASTAASNKRYDVLYQSGTPSGTDWPTGKIWYDDNNNKTLSIWNGSAWTTIQSNVPEIANDTSPTLGGDLDVATFDIVSSNNNNIDITPNGTGEVVLSTASVSDLTSGRVVLAGSSGALEDNSALTFDGTTLTTNNLSATGTASLSGITYPSSDGTSNQVISTDGNGTLSFSSISSISNAGIQNVVEDTTPQLGGDLDVNGNAIVSSSNVDIVFNPGSSGASKFVDGGVMIGSTSDPDADLEIQTVNPIILLTDTDVSGSPSCQLSGNNGNFGYYADAFNDNGGDHRWYSGGTSSGDEIMRLDSDGNVGIGSTSPQAKLEINDTGAAQADTPTIRILANTPTIRFADNSGSAESSEICGNDSALIFRVSEPVDTQTPLTEHMRITGDGNVGINTTAPLVDLQVNGSILAGPDSDEGQLSVPNYNGTDVSSYFQLNTEGNRSASLSLANCRSNSLADPAVLLSKSGGNIGTPTVLGSSQSFGHLVFNGYDGSDFVRGAQISAEVDGTPAAGSMPGRIVLSTTASSASSPTERVRIDSSGNVGIGTSSPDVELDVNGDIRASDGILFGTDTAAGNTLDDYEEGTWTPTLAALSGSFSRTYTTQAGTYTKIGNRVIASGKIKLASESGTGSSLFVQSLPFNPTVSYDSGVVGDAVNFGNIQPTALISNTSTNGFQLRAVDGTQGSANIDVSHLTNTSEFEFTVSYRVAT